MKFGIIGNTSKPVIMDVTQELIGFLEEKQTAYVLQHELGSWLNAQGIQPRIEQAKLFSNEELPNRCDMLIALGGDGTMLAAARHVGTRGIPILGVNLGKLGFLAEVSIEELKDCLNEILSGNYVREERMVLEARASMDQRVYFGLNDIVIDKGASARVIDLETHVDGDYLVTYAADGIIVTTPTGSTAYSLATGGPIVAPHSNVITINPLAPHTLTARSVVVPDSCSIRIIVTAESKSVHIAADGQVEGFYDSPAEFIIRKATYTIKLVKRKKRTYYDLLRAKLLWGRDIRLGRS